MRAAQEHRLNTQHIFHATTTPRELDKMSSNLVSEPVIRIGLIGCGEVAQVVHIPTLNFLSLKFTITYLCDISPQSLQFCAERVAGSNRPKTTHDARELCSSPDVDAVFVCSSDAVHTLHGVLALEHDKHVLIEKPLALCQRDANELIEAEKKSKGKVFVGYMRRYASAFIDAINEIGGTEGIQYVKVRDIICQNSVFINQSATFPRKFTDISSQAAKEYLNREQSMIHQALSVDMGLEVTTERTTMLRLLGGLGSHDLSAVREIIGMPKRVLGASVRLPMWQVLFEYDKFTVIYESGFNSVPYFDASIEVFKEDQIVTVRYDTPYVKGLPTTMTVRERVGESSYQQRDLRTTYEDPYTKEILEWYECILGKKLPKTTVQDATADLEIIKMILQAAN
ncbi:Alpha-N-acetylgalactosaminidase [Arthrobotrys entomopaga]|nr:Alpha-N-acetylgalactosaminidase [Arthrobotrys entomopaga]